MTMLELSAIDNRWTLFLDRDGVINHEKDTYIFNRSEFFFLDGVPEAMKYFNQLFGNIVLVTNQRGVGRGMMSEEDLIDIHEYMVSLIKEAGGRIDRIYYCTSTENSDPDRKPNPGMAIRAMKDISSIKKEMSIMVGNNLSDMEFGRNAGIHTVLLNTTGTRVDLPHPLVDLQYDSLYSFAEALKLER